MIISASALVKMCKAAVSQACTPNLHPPMKENEMFRCEAVERVLG